MLSLVRTALGTYTRADLMPVVLEAFMVAKMLRGVSDKAQQIITV